jgi:hypothetical protein
MYRSKLEAEGGMWDDPLDLVVPHEEQGPRARHITSTAFWTFRLF